MASDQITLGDFAVLLSIAGRALTHNEMGVAVVSDLDGDAEEMNEERVWITERRKELEALHEKFTRATGVADMTEHIRELEAEETGLNHRISWLESELERIRPVYEAACTWSDAVHWTDTKPQERDLIAAINTARTPQDEPA